MVPPSSESAFSSRDGSGDGVGDAVADIGDGVAIVEVEIDGATG